MSVFSRIASKEISPPKPKIPVWPLMTDFSRMVDQEINMQTMAELHDLDTEEVAELTTYLQAIGAKITALATALVTSGLDLSSATEIARAVVTSRIFPYLLRIEQGTMTEAQFKAKLGIS